MKNISLITLILLSLTFFTSCKKEYKCECNGGAIQNVYVDKMTKSEAEEEKAKCEANEGCTFKKN